MWVARCHAVPCALPTCRRPPGESVTGCRETAHDIATPSQGAVLQCPVTRTPLNLTKEIHLVNELQVASHARQRLLAAGGLPQEHGEVI